MLMHIHPRKRPVFRLLTWCTLYTFFCQLLCCSTWAYAPPTMQMSATATESGSLLDMVADFLVSPAMAAEPDTVRATIRANGGGDGTFTPADEDNDATPGEQAEKEKETDDTKKVRSVAAKSSQSIIVGGGSGSVNSVMGSYGYSYPIEVPPGRGGLVPELAITYSSAGGKGWLGLGWDLSVGSIQRSTKGGKPGYTDADTFVIILKGTAITLVREGDEFRLKDEGLFLRVLKQGESWEATDKGGTTYYFGTTSVSRQHAPEGIFKWCLDRIEDPNGNAILFTYETDAPNNQLYLQQISYDVDNSIVFESESEERFDAPPSHASYFKVRTVRRLQRIKVYHGGQVDGNLVRSYALAYHEAEFPRQSMLASITPFGSKGTPLPPTTFEPTACDSFPHGGFIETGPGLTDTADKVFHTGDFTGDGRTDYVLTPKNDGKDFWKLFRSGGDGFLQVAEGTGVDKHHKVLAADVNGDGKSDMLTYSGNVHGHDIGVELYLSNGEGFDSIGEVLTIQNDSLLKNNLYLGDFNGDGKTDALTRYFLAESDDQPEYDEPVYTLGWRLYFSTGQGFSLAQEVSLPGVNPGAAFISIKRQRFTLGDFNGDGMTDVILQGDFKNRRATVNWGLYLGTGSKLELVRQAEYSKNPPSVHDRFITGDYNGDGMTDILVTAASANSIWEGYKLFLSSGTDFVLAGEGDALSYDVYLYPGDYNGDGRTDIISEGSANNSVVVRGLYLSIGSGFQRSGAAAPRSNDRLHFGDFNGDGRMEYILAPNNQKERECSLHLSTVDTRGQLELALPNLLGKITNMLGAATEISYRPSSIWPKDIDEDGKYKSMPCVLPTASQVRTIEKVKIPNARVHTNFFLYEGGLYDIEDQEFRGFGKVTVTNTNTQSRVENYYHQDPLFQGRVSKSTTSIIGLPTDKNPYPVLHTVNDWDAIVYTSSEETERTFAYVSKNTITNYDDKGEALSTITTSYGYDDYGNMTVEDKREHNHRTGDSTSFFTRSEYTNDTENWILDRPRYLRIAANDPGDPGSGTVGVGVRETVMQYYADRPWLLQHSSEKVWHGEAGGLVETVLTTSYEYDTYGNTTWVSDPRNSDWGTRADYSESGGMFPNQITNGLGHTIKQVFDPRFGTVSTETLNAEFSSKQTTHTLYDEFGRPKSITYPDNSSRTYTYHFEPNNHYLKVEQTLMPTVTTFFDNLDREVKKVVNDGNKQIFTDTLYDNVGRLEMVSLPYEVGETPKYSTNSYDRHGRLCLLEKQDGTTIRTDHDGFTETITDEEGHVKIITKDSQGRLKTVHEPTGGVTKYEYDLFGNLTRINDPLGNETSVTYDSLGRKTAMDDPYMGHWEYRYDAAGNLIWQKDGEDRITVMEYDALNRIISSHYQATGRRLLYRYDETRNTSGGSPYFNTGMLTRITARETDGSSSTIQYNYDLMGRKVHEVRSFSTAVSGDNGTAISAASAYRIGRQFDLAGRLTSLTYPDGSTIEYDYHPMGYLESVYRVGGAAAQSPTGFGVVGTGKQEGEIFPPTALKKRSLLAYYDGHNALGQVGSLTYGNGNVTTYTYWEGNNRLKTLQTTGKINPETRGIIQNLTYTFTDRGNVQTITDNHNQASYGFAYDSLSRLMAAKADCKGDSDRVYDQVYTYDLAGNMTKKTGKAGFEVVEWEHPDKHIRPSAVLYDMDTTGVEDREVIYNQEMKPTQITYKENRTTTLWYDGEGSRIRKTSGDETTLYVGGLYELRGAEAVIHIYAGGQRIATIKGGNPFYTHGDHLGSTSLVTDHTGLLVEEVGYLPFGLTLYRKAFNNGTWSSVYRFTGQEFDEEYELYNYNARLYDPVMGRFITADTMIPDWTNPQSLNRYSYCLNNPLKYTDPTGHFAWGGLLIAMAWGALIGGVIGAAMALRNGGNVWEGFSKGAVSGAVSGAMFYCAGSFIRGEMFSSLTISSNASRAAVHTVTGAGSGAVNAAISGGDIGQGALVGALSAGMAKGLGGEHGLNMAGRVGVGTVTGGVASVMRGGDFAEGAIQGAWTSAIAHMCNELGPKRQAEARMIAKAAKARGVNQSSLFKLSASMRNEWNSSSNGEPEIGETGKALLMTGKVVVGTAGFVALKSAAFYVTPGVAVTAWYHGGAAGIASTDFIGGFLPGPMQGLGYLSAGATWAYEQAAPIRARYQEGKNRILND